MSDAGYVFDRVLLTNDDGIDAPGLRVLEEVAAELAREVWVVAPEHDQSGTSHSISLHTPLRSSSKGERRFAVLGTPGDCVVMGVRHVMGGLTPDAILSGINRGANLGVETVFSGTVGAAMTGMLLGIPSIALSQAFAGSTPVPWETSRRHAPGVIRQLAGGGWSGQSCLNVNFPACLADEAGPLLFTGQGRGLLNGIDVLTRADPRNQPYQWLTLNRSIKPDVAGSEAEAVGQRRISVTPLRFERTDDEVLAMLRQNQTS